MRETIVTCDRCKREIRRNSEYAYSLSSSCGYELALPSVDLCEECHEVVQSAVNNAVLTAMAK